jgi:hypothetical protein
VTLAADVFFVDGTAFLLSMSRQIKFITVEYVATRTAKSLSKHLTCVFQVYARAGFTVCTILMDGEFEKVKDKLPSSICNMTAAKEHMSDAEQTIHMIKKQSRGIVCTLPIEYIPRQLKIDFIYFVVLWLNAFPVKTGISSTYSP